MLSFDIGTTFSGISYSILMPGRVPEIKPVTRYPHQEAVGGDAKIPTVIYYDPANGKPVAIGAKTLKSSVIMAAEQKGWHKAEWFKLHLRSPDMIQPGETVPPLPPGKPVGTILADFMKYLYRCAEGYIEESHRYVNLKALRSTTVFILTHPNGWGGAQQAIMRKAAIDAGLVPDTNAGRNRIFFATEGECSLHFCLQNGLEIDRTDTSGVLIIDAGGGTVDVTAYRKDRGYFEEITVPECHFQGSVYVTMRARADFEEKLGPHPRYAPGIPRLLEEFDKGAKHSFKKEDETMYIRFAGYNETEKALDILTGQLAVSGATIAKFFKPSVDCIVAAIENQKKQSIDTLNVPIRSIFLVGGFSASSWLFHQVRDRAPLDTSVTRPDGHVNKAVASGGVSFYLDNLVHSRVSRHTYGVNAFVDYTPGIMSHFKRREKIREDSVSGKKILTGCFDPILMKNTRVRNKEEFRRTYFRISYNSRELHRIDDVEILCYRGKANNPMWMDSEPNMYPVLCTVGADTSMVPQKKKRDVYGRRYYEIEFSVVLLFGLTELKAQLVYTVVTKKEVKKEMRGEAHILFPDLGN